MEKTNFKIVEILSEYDILINGGTTHGIKENDKFEIYKQGRPVIDPDTKETLGYFDMIKGIVVAKKIQEKITICSSLESLNNAFTALGNALMRSHQEALNIDYNQLSDDYSEEEKKIRIGDLVRKIEVDKVQNES